MSKIPVNPDPYGPFRKGYKGLLKLAVWEAEELRIRRNQELCRAALFLVQGGINRVRLRMKLGLPPLYPAPETETSREIGRQLEEHFKRNGGKP